MSKRNGQFTPNSEYPLEVRQMIEDTTACLCCGKQLGYLQRKSARRNRGYCSLSCFYKRPPKLAYACKMHNGTPKEVLCKVLNEARNVTVAAELLGVYKQALYVWMRKYGIRRRWG